jgi:hypothetical protein
MPSGRVHAPEFDTPVDLSKNTDMKPAKVLEDDDVDDADELRLLDAIAESDSQIAQGKVIPAEEALARLRAQRRHE